MMPKLIFLFMFLVYVTSQIQINFEIKSNKVESNDLKQAIEYVAGVEASVSTRSIVLGINYVPGVCAPNYYWTSNNTCVLCSCDIQERNVPFILFQPL